MLFVKIKKVVFAPSILLLGAEHVKSARVRGLVILLSMAGRPDGVKLKIVLSSGWDSELGNIAKPRSQLQSTLKKSTIYLELLDLD